MTEYFIVAHSFAAPIVSESSYHYVEAENPEAAMQKFRKEIYNFPTGLYAANLYENADAFHKHKEPLLKWRSKEAQEEWKQ